MNKLCDIFTESGHRCPNVAKGIEKHSGRASCNKHLSSCRELYTTYKTACTDEKCNAEMSKRDLRRVRGTIHDCIKKRVMFTSHCCDGVIDEGHERHLLNLGRYRTHCDKILKERKIK